MVRVQTLCLDGVCGFVCPGGTGNCDGNPVNGCETILVENANCGGCGVHCQGTCDLDPMTRARFICFR